MKFNTTIAAISTPLGSGGIGIIRISGDRAIPIADTIFKGSRALKDAPSHTITYGHIINNSRSLKDAPSHTVSYEYIINSSQPLTNDAPSHTLTYEHIINEATKNKISDESEKQSDSSNNPVPTIKEEVIDEVLVSVFHAPRSYTTEDIVEIQSHGGIYVMQKILSLLFERGVQPAEPGEFTKRAFLGGRIDLSQAEAVMDVISAENERFLRNSERQLSGALREKVSRLKGNILHEVAFIEAALDDPEHYDLEGYPEQLHKKIEEWNLVLQRLIASAADGRLLKEGIRTVIVGKPNVGKSSLLNALSRSERAIVTDIPGTTRDTLEEQVRIGDISLVIIDTAGIRDTKDTVEQIGIERALNAAREADLILYVIDASNALDENDDRIIREIDLDRTIVLLNKSDKEQVISPDTIEKRINNQNVKNKSINDEIKDDIQNEMRQERISKDHSQMTEKKEHHPSSAIISISAKEQSGLDVLESTISKMVFTGDMTTNDDIFITNLRHKNLLVQAKLSLTLTKQSIEDGLPEDFFSIDLMDAYARLGEIIGEEVTDDLVEEIFSKFCMGK